MHVARWLFKPLSGIGQVPARAVTETLEGSGLRLEEQLAREAIQNSCDAASPDKKVRVRFRIAQLSEESVKKQFFDALQIASFEDRCKVVGSKALGLHPDNCIENRHRPVQLLYIEDYGTHGLTGDPADPESHAYRLLFSIGLTEKEQAYEASTGGSYGFGKGVLARTSRIRIVIAYSVFPEDSGGVVKRVLGASYLRKHEYDGKTWTGWSRYGPGFDVDQPVAVEGDAADRLARALGFTVRSETDIGTSLLVPDVDLNATELVHGVEKWWWPRIEDGRLEVEVHDATGGCRLPSPRERTQLRPFIECYRLALGLGQPVERHQRVGKFNRLKGKALGSWALQRLPMVEETPDNEHCLNELLGAVALIRQPRMVVQYHRPIPTRPDPTVVGVVVADTEVDYVLKLSEPPNHDRWDPGSQRLAEAPEGQEFAREIVQALHDRLKREYRDFVREGAPPPAAERHRLVFMEQQLGTLLAVPKHDGQREQVAWTEPVTITFKEGPVLVTTKRGLVRIRAIVDLGLSRASENDELNAIARFEARVLERGGADQELLEVVGFTNDGTEVQGGSVQIHLRKDIPVEVEVETAEYDPEWSVRLTVRLEDIGATQ
jgi:hypothetical protein